jgi:hypothetical protein
MLFNRPKTNTPPSVVATITIHHKGNATMEVAFKGAITQEQIKRLSHLAEHYNDPLESVGYRPAPSGKEV